MNIMNIKLMQPINNNNAKASACIVFQSGTQTEPEHSAAEFNAY